MESVTNIVAFIALFVGLGAGAVGGYLVAELRQAIRALADAKSAEIAAAVATAADARAPKRHTHQTAAGLEDALAVAVDVVLEYQSSQAYAEARLSQLQKILQTVRTGPHSYNQDNPSGNRPQKRTAERERATI